MSSRAIAGAVSCVVLAVGWAAGVSLADACTTAVVAPGGSATGTSILWKNRDTSMLSNKVVFVDEAPFDYLCLANANADSGRSCYAGLNGAGFAIMNTVAYNLDEAPGETKDLEGIIMADALRTCRTVDDFQRYLEANLGPELGSLANFGVIDGEGGAALFEVDNHAIERIDVADAPGGYLVNTNFARSGAEGDGEGYIRFERASELFSSFPPGQVDPQVILHEFTRDLGHPLLNGPTLEDARKLPSRPPVWINTRDRIDRPSTAAAVVIVGGGADRPATMWVIPGEPVTAAAIPLWVESRRSPDALAKGEEAPLWVESLRIKHGLRPSEAGHKGDYLDLTVLDNQEGTGYLPALLDLELAVFSETDELLASWPAPEALAEYQERVANRVLERLRSIDFGGEEPVPSPSEDRGANPAGVGSGGGPR